MRVLVVDDDAAARTLIARLVADLGCVVDEAASGPEALRTLAEDQTDLVILAIMMRVTNGFAVLREIRETHSAWLPVIMVTAFGAEAQRRTALELGADDVLDKPVDRRLLTARVRWLLRHREAQQALTAHTADVEALRAQQLELTEFLVHDMRNPLTVVQAALWEALEPSDILPGRETIVDAERALRRAIGMLNDVLAVSRLEEADRSLAPQDLEVAPLLDRVASAFHGQAVRQATTLIVDAPPDLMIAADPDLLTRSVENLVSNALRYAPAGGRVQLAANRNEGAVRVIVANNGPPVPPENSRRIFEKYVSTNRTIGQFGLGLYFCRRAADLHGGSIEVVETPEWPAMFVMTLPSARPTR